jgi:hypothetical protein
MKMTPQEIDDYKRNWLPRQSWNVQLHSDLETNGKEWCRFMCRKEEWHFKRWTDVYAHTFCFEDLKAAQTFKMEFGSYAEMIESKE